MRYSELFGLEINLKNFIILKINFFFLAGTLVLNLIVILGVTFF